MLELINISATRNDEILFQNLSFKLDIGSALQVSAANGVGKTTLLKIIAKIIKPNSGQINCATSLLYLGHKSNLHPALSPLQNLQFLACLSPIKTENNFLDALKLADLYEFQDTPCGELSAGQKQRLLIARLNLSASKLWLLDEPQINLDHQALSILSELYRQHLANQGMILFASHSTVELAANKIELEKYVPS